MWPTFLLPVRFIWRALRPGSDGWIGSVINTAFGTSVIAGSTALGFIWADHFGREDLRFLVPVAAILILLTVAGAKLTHQLDTMTQPKVRILFDPADQAFFYTSKQFTGQPNEYEDGRVAYIAVENLTKRPIKGVSVKLDGIDGQRADGYHHSEHPSAKLQRKEQYRYGEKKANFTLNPRQDRNPYVARQYVAVAARSKPVNPAQTPACISLCYSPHPESLEDGTYTLKIGVYGDVGEPLGADEFVVGVDAATGQMTFGERRPS